MKKASSIVKTAVITLVFIAALGACRQKDTVPSWVHQQPKNTDDTVFFIGKSEKEGSYDNYLEAKAGALADILIQFSLYRGAYLSDTIRDYRAENADDPENADDIIGFEDNTSELSFNINSAGLYQRDEWLDTDGTLYVLCVFEPGGSVNPMPDLPQFFQKRVVDDGRIYFTAMAVSPQKTDELGLHAEKNAQLQALLWLGAEISGGFTDYTAINKSNPDDNAGSCNGSVQCVSTTNIESIALRQEAKRLTRGQNKKYYYYGLYSMRAEDLNNTSGNNCFKYSIEYEYGLTSGEIYRRQVDFLGDSVTRSEHNDSRSAKPHTEIPGRIKDALRATPEDALLGISEDNTDSMILNTVTTAIRAAAEIARQIDTSIQDMIRDYTADSESGNGTMNFTEYLSTSKSAVTIAGAVKIADVADSENSSLWQLWQVQGNDILRRE